MKQIATFKTKVIFGTDRKRLADNKYKKYTYGAISVRTTKLTDFIGKKVVIKVYGV